MSKFILLLALVILLADIPTQHVDANPITGWPIVQRCLDLNTASTQGWDYDGTLLFTGISGIHGIQQDWSTPRVLVFLNDTHLAGGALSPDGQWYAVPTGTFEITSSYNGISTVEGLRVYRVDGSGEFIPISLQSTQVFFQYSFLPIHWLDNQSFIYVDGVDIIQEYVQIKPFGDVVDVIPDTLLMPETHPLYALSVDKKWVVTNRFRQGWQLDNLDTRESVVLDGLLQDVFWSPNSVGFVATLRSSQDTDAFYTMTWFDTTRVMQSSIVSGPYIQGFAEVNNAWSYDSRYFATAQFHYFQAGNEWPISTSQPDNRLFVADFQSNEVIDTCLSTGRGLAFSPNHDQLAFFEAGNGQRPLYILDLPTWSLHQVARHNMGDGSFRTQMYAQRGLWQMLGWRSNTFDQ